MLWASVLLVAIGLLMVSKPSFVWLATESWKANDSTEPSDLYLLSTRVGGVLVMLAGLGGAAAEIM